MASRASTFPSIAGEIEGLFENMASEAERLYSFRIGNWPSILNPRLLAEAGFFYLMSANRVQCAFCKGVIADWIATDDPLAVHRSTFDECPFMIGYDVGNVPIGVDPCLGLVPSPEATKRVLSSYSVETFRLPVFPQFAQYDSRVETFESWQRNPAITPRALAAAGFFYSGVLDWVQCFSCGNKFKDWVIGDCAFLEHAFYVPDCQFVRLQKGNAYVNAAQSRAKSKLIDCKSDIEYVIKQWHASDIVEQLKQEAGESGNEKLSKNTIDLVLINRYRLCQSPYLNFNELRDDVMKLSDDREKPGDAEDTLHKGPTQINCHVCLDKALDIIFLPCKHLATCVECAPLMNCCPVCRQVIRGYVGIL